MKKREKLFYLIKSLTKTEKRYISMQLSMHKNSPLYLKLISIIGKMSSYEESDLKNKYKELDPLTPLPRVKEYLYLQLEKSLLNYNLDHSIYGKIMLHLHSTEQFYHKNLYTQSWDAMMKSKKLAIASEKYALLIDILNWERRLINFVMSDKASKKKTLLQEDFKATLKKVNIEEEYAILTEQIHLITSGPEPIRTRIELLESSGLIENPLLSDLNSAITRRAKLHFNNAHFFKHRLYGEYQEALQFIQSNINIIESSKEFRTYNPYDYLICLSNLALSLTDLKMANETIQVLEKLKRLGNNAIYKRAPRYMAFIHTCYYEMMNILYVNTGQFKEAETIRNASEDTLRRYAEWIEPEQVILFYDVFATACFGSGDFQGALKWTNKIINNPSHLRNDIKSQYFILNIIIHYELDNVEYLNHCVQSAHKFLKRLNTGSNADLILLKHLRKIDKISDKDKIQKFFNNLLLDFEPLTKNPEENFSYRNFEFIISWLISKRDSRNFGEVYRERISKT